MDLSKFDTTADISNFDVNAAANRGAKLEIKAPDGSMLMQADGKTPVTITLLGMDSDKFTERKNATINKRIQQGARLKITAQSAQDDGNRTLAACTVAWDGIVLDGETLECTFDNAVKLYSDKRFPWLREQVDEFIAERENFLKASSGS